MGFLCLIRGAFMHVGCYAAQVRNYAGLRKCATSLPTSGTRVKRYCQATTDRKDASGQFVCYHLPHRTIVKIEGQETSTFLQGLITNDMGLLVEEPEQSAMYSHMLSVQGRTLYDIILYRLKEVESGFGIFLECDCTVKNAMLKHLKIYKIRRKVDINHCPELSVWAVLPTQRNTGQDDPKPELSSPDKALAWDSDPRTQEMGWRLVINSQVDPIDVVASCRKGETEDYHRHRYSIGIPEGVRDLPPGVALPLESNLVYMQGISFSKGCYIGQELTARTHHTGVIRKRLMPVRLSAPVQDLEEGAELETELGKSAGKHRAGVGTLGLSLVRTAYANDVLTLKSSDDAKVTLQASVPGWWPEDVTIS